MAKYTDPRPEHQQITALLRAQIMDGSRSGQLPVTKDLTEDFGVANSTITKVLDALRAEGLIHTTRGRLGGAYAADWSAHVIDASVYVEPGGRVTYDGLMVDEVDTPGDVARLLATDRAILRHRVMLLDGEPVEVADSYVDVELATRIGLDRRKKLRGGMAAVLAEAGLPQRRFIDIVSARQPTTAELEALRLPASVPVLRILRTVLTDGDRIVGVDVIVKGAHLYQERYVRDVE